MKITITTKKQILDDKLGRLFTGETYEMPDSKALFYISRGEAMGYQTKVLQDRPLAVAGKVEQSSVLPADPASTHTTAAESESGVKKRGRKPKQSS
jgi:hypothetical protein